MPDTVPFAYAEFPADQSIYLQIEGVQYPLAQFSSTFALNQIPEATCLLAVGRDTAEPGAAAPANISAGNLKQMVVAQVFLKISGDFLPGGDDPWPETQQLVFDGYLTGIAYQKVNGKLGLVVNLIHWLVDLGFSSCLTAVSHIASDADLTGAALIPVFVPGAGGGSDAGNTLGVMTSQSLGVPVLEAYLTTDLWKAIKSFLCALTTLQGFVPVCENDKQFTVDNQARLITNTRAQMALKRIEGPTDVITPTDAVDTESDCSFKAGTTSYVYGLPLPLPINSDQGRSGVAEAIGGRQAGELLHLTFWDLLVNRYCDDFALTLAPGIDRAVMLADAPAYRGGDPWRYVGPDEYEFIEQTSPMPRPLRAVVVHGLGTNDTGAYSGDGGGGNPACWGGVYIPTDLLDESGVVLYRQVKPWIASLLLSGDSDSTGVRSNAPIPTATDPAVTIPPTTTAGVAEQSPRQMIDQTRTVANQLAQAIFVTEMLRGRTGTISGKLRFDIAPGAQLQLGQKSELFIDPSIDSLAGDLFAQVNRVTIEIDAEGRRASTAFVLTHLRNTAENESDQTSTAVHPFYGTSVVTGFPLLPAYEFADSDSNN